MRLKQRPDPVETPFMKFDKMSRWPLFYYKLTGQFFIIMSLIAMPVPGRHWIDVLDVTHAADYLVLNQGLIRDGQVYVGPGEAYASIPSDEGVYGLVVVEDEHALQTIQIPISQLAIDIDIPID